MKKGRFYINNLTKGFFSALLSVSLIFTAVLPITAEADMRVISVDPERFLTDSIVATSGQLVLTEEGYAELTPENGKSAVIMSITPLKADTEANAIRLVLKNNSPCNLGTIEYSYKNADGRSVSESLDFSIKANTGNNLCEYILPVPAPDSMTSLTIVFDGVGSGQITLVSFAAVSGFFDDREYVGELYESRLYREESKAVFSGTVSYETTVAYQGASVVLYRLDPGEKIEDVTHEKEFVSSQPMTLNFRFEFVPYSTTAEISKYFAAVLTEDKEIIPITPAAYLNGELGEVARSDGEVGFKGSETELYAWASESGSSFAIVDIFLDRIDSKTGTGYQYVLDGAQHYFDRNYIDKLDREIKSYRDVGCDVYLRFLIDADNVSDSKYCGAIPSSRRDGAEYLAIDTRRSGVTANLFSVADFLLSRYSGGDRKDVRGMILGSSLDRANEYYFAENIPMGDFAEIISESFMIFKKAMEKNSVDLELVLPISDSYFGKELIITKENRDGIFYSDMLLDSVYYCMNSYGADLSDIYIMLESTSSPFDIAEDEEGFGYSIKESKTLSAHHLEPLYEILKDLSADYRAVNNDMFFCFMPNTEVGIDDIYHSYIYNYNVLSCNENIRGYVMSMLLSDGETESLRVSTLRSAFKYIDTDIGTGLAAPLLKLLGVSEWKDIIPNYSKDMVAVKKLVEKDLTYSKSNEIKGSYCLWNFESANGTLDWSPSVGCESISVYTATGNSSRALVAHMSNDDLASSGAVYGRVIYHARHSLPLKEVDVLSFDVFIPQMLDGKDSAGHAYEIVVSVVGNGVTSESKGRVFAGQTDTVYADISEMSDVDYIILSARSLDVNSNEDYYVCVNGISIHSKKHTGSELEEIVLSGEMGNGYEDVKRIKLDGLLVVGTTVGVSIFAVAMIGFICFIKKKKSCD